MFLVQPCVFPRGYQPFLRSSAKKISLCTQSLDSQKDSKVALEKTGSAVPQIFLLRDLLVPLALSWPA